MTDIRLAGSNLEVMGSGSSSARVASSYIEALSSGTSDRRVVGVELEVLLPGEMFIGAGSIHALKDSTNSERLLWRWDGVDLVSANFITNNSEVMANPSIVSVGHAPATTLSGVRSVTLSETPQPGDVVVLCYVGSNSAVPSVVEGLGATWDVAGAKGISTSGPTHWYVVGTGANTSGVINITTTPNSLRQAALYAYLIRGLGGFEVVEFDYTSVFGSTLIGPNDSAWPGCVVIGLSTGKTTNDWPVASTALPSMLDWVESSASDIFESAYAIPQALGTFETSLSVPTPNTSLMISQLVIRRKASV